MGMLDTIFDIPLPIAGLLIIGSLCAFAIGGLLLVRRAVLPRLRIRLEDSEFSGSMLQAIMVFYGLAVALIAVSVFETHSEVSAIVTLEASELGALYRDASSYPEPIRQELQAELRDYARYVIDTAWPAQRTGTVALEGVAMLNRFQATLTGFEPASEGQRALHAEALRAYNQLVEARSMRIDAAANSGLSGVLWVLVVAGAVIGLSATFFFKVDDVRLHAVMVGLLAAFIGLVIFMILAFDRPFRGDLALGPDAYQQVYDVVMRDFP
jgi:phage shock protein PspC (stress-responsive transcriptional regulator)